jgi:hypothetical protein
MRERASNIINLRVSRNFKQERVMIYRNIAPSPEVHEYVRDYLIAHFVFENNQPIPIKAFAPRPEQAITFFQ